MKPWAGRFPALSGTSCLRPPAPKHILFADRDLSSSLSVTQNLGFSFCRLILVIVRAASGSPSSSLCESYDAGDSADMTIQGRVPRWP